MGLGQRGRCCLCAACPNHKRYLEIRSANKKAFRPLDSRLSFILFLFMKYILFQFIPSKNRNSILSRYEPCTGFYILISLKKIDIQCIFWYTYRSHQYYESKVLHYTKTIRISDPLFPNKLFLYKIVRNVVAPFITFCWHPKSWNRSILCSKINVWISSRIEILVNFEATLPKKGFVKELERQILDIIIDKYLLQIYANVQKKCYEKGYEF